MILYLRLDMHIDAVLNWRSVLSSKLQVQEVLLPCLIQEINDLDIFHIQAHHRGVLGIPVGLANGEQDSGPSAAMFIYNNIGTYEQHFRYLKNRKS